MTEQSPLVPFRRDYSEEVDPSPGFPVLATTQSSQLLHERFIAEYLKDFSTTRAWIRAHDGTFEGSHAVATAQAARCLAIQVVRDEVKRRQRDRLTLDDVTAERIQLELARIAFADVGKATKRVPIINPLDGKVKRDVAGNILTTEAMRDMDEIDEDTRRAIASVDPGNGDGKRTVKMVDKRAALMDLAKITGMVVERKQIAAKMSVQINDDAFGDDEILALAASTVTDDEGDDET